MVYNLRDYVCLYFHIFLSKNISWGPQIGVIKINDTIMESESVVKNFK